MAPLTDISALALTIWGEARGEPIEGKIGVANVMRNRYLAHYRGAKSYVDVCTAHAQFSAWTDERDAMQKEAACLVTAHPDELLLLCLDIARATIAGKMGDNTRGANHYYATSIPAPNWATGQPCLAELGHHRFFNVA